MTWEYPISGKFHIVKIQRNHSNSVSSTNLLIFPNLLSGPKAPMDPEIWDHAELGPLLNFLKQAAAEGTFSPDPLFPMQIRPCPEARMKARERYLNSLAK